MQVYYKGEEVSVCNSLWRAREYGEIINGLAPISLEVLSKDMKEVFPTDEAWEHFMRGVIAEGTFFLGNFLAEAQSVSRLNHETVLYTYTTPVPVITGWKAGDKQLRMVVSELQNVKLLISFEVEWRFSEVFHEAWQVTVKGTLLPPIIDEDITRETV